MRLFRVTICATALMCLFATSPAGARSARYAVPVPDPAGIIDLPPGFTYKIVARAGDEMSDGLPVPGLPDGMGAFEGPNGTTIVVCNHECIFPRHGAFGSDGRMLARIDTTKVYDRGEKQTPAAGATSTFVWDTRTQKLVRHYLSLAGTLFNCAGGTTPWGTWLTCEERTYRAGTRLEEGVYFQRDHGYVFEVPALADGGLADPIPLVALGRFTHESVQYDERSGILYQTEDLHDGLFYRFLPALRGDLRAGGRLQALALKSGARESNNQKGPIIKTGMKLDVKWIDMDRVEAPENDLRIRGYDLGAIRFDRPEGMCMVDGDVYFACTSGGKIRAGQIWRYTPSKWEGQAKESEAPGRMELYYEVADTTLMVNPDNVTTSPAGELFVCEDPEYAPRSRLVVVTRDRQAYTFAKSRLPGELTGAVFSPDRSTMFLNMQKAGITLAITGPWRKQ